MKLFIRIFLCFWIATILMIAAVITTSNLLPFITSQDKKTRFDPDVASEDLARAINTFERQGAAAFLAELDVPEGIHHSSVYLMDQDGNVLVNAGKQSASDAEMAREALETQHSELIRFGIRTAFACPIQSATGRRYAAVMNIAGYKVRPSNPRFWFDLTIAMISTSIVCLGLSFYLTRPITKLRETAQRLAGGDLSARATSPRTIRRDEIGDLARDFDVMAAQIQLLMTAQRRFVADVSHELGAPLTRMHLALALLRRRLAGQSVGELERIERETDKLSNLVQQLLLLAGLEAGTWPAETLTAVSMKSFCEDIIEDASFEAAHRDCRVAGTCQEITVLVYPSLLRKAIDNVLRNAIRYTSVGTEVTVDFSADLIQEEIWLEIVDRGPGVPESMLSDIFRPFFRTAPGRESNSGGTGLGLAIAYEAIRLHDGTIMASNRAEGGLRVAITLPLRAPAGEEELQATTNHPGEIS
jgi:two-component system sensor histidine kinase CpxA